MFYVYGIAAGFSMIMAAYKLFCDKWEWGIVYLMFFIILNDMMNDEKE